ncbi:MAG TPA: adenylate/guanylate cyclase domain-containing protein [Acidimicrobiales bacterium]|nr:adenylate/guanylate cyclase domain-containing protein [Acidimicrobiales bacterium]
MGSRVETAADLASYFPRFAVDWARDDPDRTWRADDASLVFVDISGFTALSERLARRGHLGAEELTQTLSTCFADLLVAAYADGGSLVKFGGDALLLLFEGDDHAGRAVRSALQMRARLGRSGRIATSVGNIRLRMSAGVHSGVVHLFRVGASHRELLIAGPGPSSVVAMEQTANAGQIVISAGTAERIPARLVGDAAGPGYFLKSRPPVSVDASFPPTRDAGVDLRAAIPVALRDHLAGSVEPEHRRVTVAFIRFDGIDAVIENDGAATAAEVLDELVTDVQAAVDHEGATFLGTDADKDGGKLIVIGGAPRALDDDEGRVLRAMRRVVERERRLPVRIGVHHGHAFVGEVGPSYRRTYTVMGDTVNLAARLMASAEPGEVRATREVLDLAASEFDTTALPPFFVKGKSRPVDAVLVGERVRRRTRALTDLPFVGREVERERLRDALDEMRAGRGGLIDIAGEAGIGKSRLLREFLADAAELPTVTTFCEAYEATTPYFAVRFLLRGALGMKTASDNAPEVLRVIVSEAAPELLPWLPLIGSVMSLDVPSTPESEALDPRFLRDQTVRAVVDLLAAVVTGAQLFVVEDAQWVDDLSAEVLRAIAQRARSRRWLVCLSRRIDDTGYRPGDETTLRLLLDALDDTEARRLLQAAAGAASGETLLRPDQVDVLVERAGGNPLFVERLAHAAASGAGEATLSGSLEAVVAAKIDTLPPRDRQALRYAAVLGPMFETARLSELVAEEGGAARAVAGLLRQFLEPSGTGWLRFRNECYREVAYETLSFRKRKELHAKAGASIEATLEEGATEGFEILSFHFWHAQQYEKCWHYSRAAAERARAKYANVEAAVLYERALAAGGQIDGDLVPSLAQVYRSLAEVALIGNLYDRAKAALARARALRKDDAKFLADVCRLETILAANRGQNANAARWVNRGLRLLEGNNGRAAVAMRAELRMLRADQFHRANDNRQALVWAEQAIADAKAARNRKALARAYTVADLASARLGRPDAGRHLRAALAIWTELDVKKDEGDVRVVLGATAYWKGEWDEALDQFIRSRDAYTAAGDLVTAGYGTTNVTDILLDQGRGEEVTGLGDVVNLWRSVGHPGPVPGALTNMGRAALQLGDVLKARDVFDQARWAAEDLGADTAEYDYWVAECMIREGAARDARTLLERALRDETKKGGALLLPRLHRGIGYAHLALGDPDATAVEFERAVDAARANGSPYEVALGLDALVRVRPSEAAAAERDEVFNRLGVRATFPPLVQGVAADGDGFAS